ncbi:hypothetical protein [Paremcibacter congregatus]|uniref:Uncharacterized protein n=1 Tax=Paremcibacter congregatus TaxID=2043170 RepID=A0A2G4YQ10_9PROT|nr:hypothetical protein [Paremcibacter congregatus]PHZ84412.1 hypothetical protein CRD36_11390 [Paremcibacter congregatus]QDE28630.1 hypothetical protein FIV45_15800 [Paremcibacter congregatus]
MDDDFEIDALEEYPTLVLVARFAKLIPRTDWFRYVGEPLEKEVVEKSRAYLDALGFPEATPAEVEDWQEAAASLETNDWNSPFWEVEQQLLSALSVEITETLDPQLLEMVLAHVTSVASEYVGEGVMAAAERWGMEDEELLKAAIGEGVQACYQAALVIAAGVGDDHPFALKYQLYETGWWPLGVMGNSFNIF